MKRGPISTHKKVVIHTLDAALVKGYVDQHRYVGPAGVEVIDQEGHLLKLPLEGIKGVFFVRDFEGNRQRQERKVFHSRPKLSGLWVRMTFKDQEVLEGLIPTNLLEIDPLGFLLAPPDVYSNNVKVFVPRSTIASMEVLGVISDGSSGRALRRVGGVEAKPRDATAQFGLFPSARPSENK